jgi:hypothetical protein
MDREEYEHRQREIAAHAASEGADYFDPHSPIIWKRYIIGPVPRWRRFLWWFFPPSHAKIRRIMQRRSDAIWKEATDHVTGRDVARVVSLSLALPVLFSLVGPIYYGFTHGPYWRVIIWASVCIAIFCWQARAPFKHALSTARPSIIGRFLLVLTIVTVIAIGFLVGDMFVYLFARSL